jgi:beta-N-acetylhexosaminidase
MRSSALVLTVGVLLAGCAAPAPAPHASAPRAPHSAVPPTLTAPLAPAAGRPPAASGAAARVERMTARAQAGTVLMTAATVGELASLRPLVAKYGLAGVMARGRSTDGVSAVHRAVQRVRSAEPAGLPLLVATDQEGGTVQVLRGPGFGEIPSAVQQARWPDATLRGRANGWARALAAAGVNLDLAPVADTPCDATAHDNPPVADLLRNYGTQPGTAARKVAAVVRGFEAAGVATTLKHFPGLGCVRANTDTDTRVVDTAIGVQSERLAPFRSGIAAGADFVMMSSATYARIDGRRPALFSSAVIRDLLRTRLNYQGVVMSDDVGGAAAVDRWSPGERAIGFLAAGGDLMLNIVPDQVPDMVRAIERRAKGDPAFASRLRAAATRVVAARLAVTDRG